MGASVTGVLAASEYHSVFKRFQIGDHVADLTGIKLKLRHTRMARRDAFSQSLSKVLDRDIAGVTYETAARFSEDWR